jgi:hypothetical protein
MYERHTILLFGVPFTYKSFSELSGRWRPAPGA